MEAAIAIEQINARRWALIKRVLLRLQKENEDKLDINKLEINEIESKLIFTYQKDIKPS